jgi:hypothetical protein
MWIGANFIPPNILYGVNTRSLGSCSHAIVT